MGKTQNHPPYKIDPWKISPDEIGQATVDVGEIPGSPIEVKTEIERINTDYSGATPTPTPGLENIYKSIEETQNIIDSLKALGDKQEEVLRELETAVEKADLATEESQNTKAALTSRAEELLSQIRAVQGEQETLLQSQTEALKKAGQASEAAKAASDALERYKTTVRAEFDTHSQKAQDAKDAADRAAGALSTYKEEAAREIEALGTTARNATSKAESAVDALDKYKTSANQAIQAAASKADSASKAAKAVSDSLSAYKTKVAQDIASAVSAATQGVATTDGLNSAIADALKSVPNTAVEAVKKSQEFKDAVKKAQDALSGAQGAQSLAEQVRDTPQVSNSVIPLILGTTTPAWQEGLKAYPRGTNASRDAALPEGITHYYGVSTGQVPVAGQIYSTVSSTNVVTVDSRLEYEATMWITATRNDTQNIFVTLCDENGNRNIVEKVDAPDANPHPSADTWGNPVRAIIKRPTTEWQKVTTRFKFKEGTRFARVNEVYFGNGSGGPAFMYIADLRIYPKIPTQYDVDAAQNKAIDALGEAQKATQWQTDNNSKLIEAHREALDWQTKRNQVQTDIDAAQTEAIRALTKVSLSSSILGYAPLTDEEILAGVRVPHTPIWATGLTKVPETRSEFKVSYRQDIDDRTTVVNAPAEWVKVDKGVRYRFAGWVHTPSATTASLLVRLEGRDAAGRSVYHAIVDNSYTIKHSEDNVTIGYRNGWLLGILGKKKAGWQKVEMTFDIKPEVEDVRFHSIQFNSRTDAYGSARWTIAGFELGPDVPTQVQVDAAQNQAIISNSRAIKSFTENGSLIPFYRPTDEEVLAGTTKWNHPDYRYWAGHRETNETTSSAPEEVKAIGWAIGTANSSQGTLSNHDSPLVNCTPGGSYKVSFWAYANVSGSKIYIELRDQGGTLAVASSSDSLGKNAYLVGDLELRQGWHKYEGVITLRDRVDQVRLSAIYWNHPNGTNKGVQLISGLQVNPNTPTQAEIDSLQNQAIGANTAALVSLAKVSLGGSLVGYADLTEEEIKAGARHQKTPAWTTAGDGLACPTPVGFTVVNCAAVASGVGTKLVSQIVPVRVEAGMDYRYSYWAYGNSGTNLLIRIINTKTGSYAKNTQVVPEGNVTTAWGIGGYTSLSSGWKKYEGRITFGEEVEQIAIDRIEWHHSRGGKVGVQAVANLEIVPDVPTQTEVDDTQNKAIEANTNALTSLARVELGGSIVPYLDLTPEEIKQGLRLPYKPVWADGANIHLPSTHSWVSSRPEIQEAWGSSNERGQHTSVLPTKWTSLTLGVPYKLSFWARAHLPGSRMYIQIKTPVGEDNSAIASLRRITGVDSEGRRTTTSVSGATSYPVQNLEIPNTWQKFEFEVVFKESISRVAFWRIYWNHPNGTTAANQYLAGLEFAPDLPSQHEINTSHSKAIEALQKFQDLQRETNSNQTEIDKLQNDLIQLAFPDLDVLPRESSGRPYFARVSGRMNMMDNEDMSPIIYLDNKTTKSYTSTSESAYFYPISGVNLRVQLGTYNDTSASSTSGRVRLRIVDANGRDAIESVNFSRSRYRSSDSDISAYGVNWKNETSINQLGANNRWYITEHFVKLRSGVDKARVILEKDNGGIVRTSVKISAYSDYQLQIDKAQNEALKQASLFSNFQREINDKQGEINNKFTETDQKIADVVSEHDRTKVGMCYLRRDRFMWSQSHGVGAIAPSLSRELKIYVAPSFVGTVTSTVYYSNGSVFTEIFRTKDFTLYSGDTPGGKSQFSFLVENRTYKGAIHKVPTGTVLNAIIYVDHLEWGEE